jgi:hypothetical protein
MRGGKRPNAGRKAGSTTTKSAIERAALKEAVTTLKNEGETPLEVLLSIMRTTENQETKIDCAKAAAPYIHPRLTSIEANVNAKLSHEETLRELENEAGVGVRAN